MRTVLKSVGMSLSKYKDTKELATAFRDAIEGTLANSNYVYAPCSMADWAYRT